MKKSLLKYLQPWWVFFMFTGTFFILCLLKTADNSLSQRQQAIVCILAITSIFIAHGFRTSSNYYKKFIEELIDGIYNKGK